MKILFTVTHIYGASGLRALVNLANALNRRGHEVLFLVEKTGIEKGQRPFYPLDDAVEIRNLRRWKPPSAASRSERIRHAIRYRLTDNDGRLRFDRLTGSVSRLARRIHRKARRLLHRDIHSREWWETKFEVRISKLRDEIHRIAPDVVVAFLPSSFTYVGRALDASQTPYVVANRNSPFKDYTEARFCPSRYDVAMRFRAVEHCALNLVQLEAYREFFAPEVQKKTRVIPNWVESVPEPLLAHPGEDAERNLILAVGRLHEQKNHELLIDAFAKLADRNPSWEVSIAGAGELEEQLRNRIEGLGLAGRIHLLGVRDDVDQLYASARIFAFPSKWEGFSNAHLESMAHGLPTVGLASCIYTREIVQRSKGGRLSTGEVDDYAATLGELMGDPAARAQLGRNARAFAEQFGREAIVDQWETVLEEAVRSGAPSAAGKA